MKIMKSISYLLLCTLMSCLIACSDDNGVAPEPDPILDGIPEGYTSVEVAPDNWDGTKRADISYQILVYSFADSDGDKYGDINGVISKLDYINSLGVKAVWLSPIHPSPSYHGYDVTDYTKINPKFGTDDDFDRLIAEAHKRNIKVYLDYVLNHTSIEHPWFQQAKTSVDNEYRNYYIFSQAPAVDIKEGKIDMISSENAGGYNAAEWFSVSGDEVKACYKFLLDWSNPSKPTVTVIQGNTADISENTATDTENDKFIWFGKDICKKFFDKGNGIYELTVDFTSNWGFLIRTSNNPNWPAGTKYGAVSEDVRLTLGKTFILNSSIAANIMFSDMDMWKYHSHFYTASFADLNYGKAETLETSPVFRKVTDAAKGWIDRGVDGFRLDAVKHIYHNDKSDENPVFLKKFYDELNTYYKGKGKTDELYMVGEVLSDAEVVAPYYKGLPALFEFSFWYRLEWAINNSTGRYFAKDILNYQQLYQANRENYIEATKLSNHDEDRAGLKFDRSEAKEKLAAAVLLTAAGAPYIYYGEELGFYGITKEGNGDQHVREPMQWGDNTTTEYMNGISKSSVKSVVEQQEDKNSLLNTYLVFTKLRNTYSAMAEGIMSSHAIYNESNAKYNNIAAWYRTKGDEKMLVLHNFGSTPTELSLADNIEKAVGVSGKAWVKEGDKVTIKLGEYSSVIFKIAQ